MFSLVSGVYDAYFSPTKLNLLVVGANGVGKTALLERLKVTQFTKHQKPAPSSTTKHQSKQEEFQRRTVPESFLPIVMRQKQRALDDSFRSGSSYSNTTITTKNGGHSHPQQQNQNPVVKAPKKEVPALHEAPKRRSFLSCPAPAKYAQAQEESSDDEGDDDDDSIAEKEVVQQRPPNNREVSEDYSLEEVNLDQSEAAVRHRASRTASTKSNSNSYTHSNGGLLRLQQETEDDDSDDDEDDEDDEDDQQHDLKDKTKPILPLHKIRPTIGMNLAKLEMCGAQCHIWDLGGKMHDLWTRYYQDCDAVVFVWKIVDDSLPELDNDGGGDKDYDSDDSRLPHVSAEHQLALLEQVRDNIPDDVPFLIWGHWFPSIDDDDDDDDDGAPTKKKDKAYKYNDAYSTGSLLPHYHNPLMSLYFGSAKSGGGVRAAMEWLIPIAARQKKFRDKSTSSSSKP